MKNVNQLRRNVFFSVINKLNLCGANKDVPYLFDCNELGYLFVFWHLGKYDCRWMYDIIDVNKFLNEEK